MRQLLLLAVLLPALSFAQSTDPRSLDGHLVTLSASDCLATFGLIDSCESPDRTGSSQAFVSWHQDVEANSDLDPARSPALAVGEGGFVGASIRCEHHEMLIVPQQYLAEWYGGGVGAYTWMALITVDDVVSTKRGWDAEVIFGDNRGDRTVTTSLDGAGQPVIDFSPQADFQLEVYASLPITLGEPLVVASLWDGPAFEAWLWIDGETSTKVSAIGSRQHDARAVFCDGYPNHVQIPDRGFSGWIAAVSVFDRPLTSMELDGVALWMRGQAGSPPAPRPLALILDDLDAANAQVMALSLEARDHE